MANKETDLIFEAYMEAKEAPKGKHYDSAGRLRKGDADADGRGGPKYRSDPTYVNPNESEETITIPVKHIKNGKLDCGCGKSPCATYGKMGDCDTPEEDNLGLGPNTPKMVKITVGSTMPMKPKTEAPIEDEAVFIQAGERQEDSHDDKHKFDYDGEIDMARAELLKANDYSAKLFDMIGQHEAIPGWVASKITKAGDYLSSVFHYIDYEMNFGDKDGDCDEEDEKKVEIDDFDGDETAKDSGFGGA